MSQKMGEIYVAQTETVDALNFQGCFIENVNNKLVDLEKRDIERKKQIDTLSRELRSTKEELSLVNTKVNENTKELRSCNMIINGIAKDKDENCKDVSLKFFRNLVPNYQSDKILLAYRVGKERKDGEVNRAMFVKFRDVEAKQEVMKRKSVLRKNKSLGLGKVFCNDDLPEDVRQKRQEMREIARYAVSIGYRDIRVTGDKLIFSGNSYQEDELHLLPKEIQMANVRTRKIGDKIGFLSEYSYLSNFYAAQVEINGQCYDSSEQAYQYMKAVLCDRDDVAKEIKKSTIPKKIKRHGDKIDTTEQWESMKVDTMKCILVAKFMQNKDLKQKLVETGRAQLMECSTNKFWGTGWKLDSLEWTKSHQYPGKNVLGNLLMEVRELISTPKSSTDIFNDLFQMTPVLAGVSTIRRVPMGSQGSLASKSTESLSSVSNADNAIVQKGNNITPARILSEKEEKGDGDDHKVESMMEGIAEQAAAASSSSDTAKNGSVESNQSKDQNKDEDNHDAPNGSYLKPADMDIEEAEATSFSCDSDLLRSSFSAKSVTTEDGYLDCDKMMSWGLPTVNISRLRDIANKGSLTLNTNTNTEMQGTHRKRQSTSALVHSTPVSHVTRRKSRKPATAVRTTEQLIEDEKQKLLLMVSRFKNNE